jgi:hypothetical protein
MVGLIRVAVTSTRTNIKTAIIDGELNGNPAFAGFFVLLVGLRNDWLLGFSNLIHSLK